MEKENLTSNSPSKKAIENVVPTNPNQDNTPMNPFFQSNLNNANVSLDPSQDQSFDKYFKDTPYENNIDKTNFLNNSFVNHFDKTNFTNNSFIFPNQTKKFTDDLNIYNKSIPNIAGKFSKIKPIVNDWSITENFSKIYQGDDENLPVVSVIVTLFSGCSYDNLFRSVKQVAPEGRVSLYSASLNWIDQLLKVLNGEAINDEDLQKTVDALLTDIESVEPDCVLFNWECCSGCGNSFPQKEKTMELLKLLMDRQFMAMFSDFAMKSLIIDWDENLLGSNPFVRLGDCTSRIKLKFNPEVLKDCPSSQLKMVGQLCDNGVANLHALASTIVFGIDFTKVDAARFQLKVLTIATESIGFKTNDQSKFCEIGDEKGTVGHAMIKFNNGGILFVSAGHWIELNNFDVNVTNLEKEAEKFGGGFSEMINSIKSSKKSDIHKTQELNQLANQFVQQCAPCNYSLKGLSKNK